MSAQNIGQKVTRVSRRRWLQSVTATMALPSLEIFTAHKAFAATPQNFLTLFFPNGRRPEKWDPTGSDGNIQFNHSTQALTHFKDKTAVLMKMLNNPGAKSPPNSQHSQGCSSILTGTRKDLRRITNNISIDQIIANHIGTNTRFKSLQFSSGYKPQAKCDANGVSCKHTQTICWADASTPLDMTINIKTAFNQLFGPGSGFKPMAASGGIDATSANMTSVLDVLLEDAKDLKNALGISDQQRLEQYFEGLRNIEKRLQTTGMECSTSGWEEPPTLNANNYPQHVAAYHDLIVLALSCGQTKVITYMIDFGLSQRIFTHLGFNDAEYHRLSHANGGPRRVNLVKAEKWQLDMTVELLKKLESTPGANGKTLLDETLCFLIPSMGDGDQHDHNNTTAFFVGGDGTIKTDGRIIPKHELADVHVSLMDAYGITKKYGKNGARFGDDGRNSIEKLLR